MSHHGFPAATAGLVLLLTAAGCAPSPDGQAPSAIGAAPGVFHGELVDVYGLNAEGVPELAERDVLVGAGSAFADAHDDVEIRGVHPTRGRTRVVSHAPELLSRPRRGRRIAAKSVGALQLVKSALTFGDWMPYALWKLERHTGTRLDPSERQRRHPFLFAWPLVFRVLARRELR